MVASLRNNKWLNSVLKLWLRLMWLPQPGDFKWLLKQFQTFLIVGILHTQYESMKLSFKRLICGYHYKKVLKMWLLSLVIIFSGLVEVVKPQNLFHVYNEVFRNFQKAMIMICAKYLLLLACSLY